MGRPLGAGRLGLSHWAGPLVTGSARLSQSLYGVGGIISCCMLCLLEPSSRARMHYKNHLKSCFYSIMQNPETILRGTKHKVSEVPQMSLQLFHKILLIHMIPTV